jgi:hypothetical protein
MPQQIWCRLLGTLSIYPWIHLEPKPPAISIHLHLICSAIFRSLRFFTPNPTNSIGEQTMSHALKNQILLPRPPPKTIVHLHEADRPTHRKRHSYRFHRPRKPPHPSNLRTPWQPHGIHQDRSEAPEGGHQRTDRLSTDLASAAAPASQSRLISSPHGHTQAGRRHGGGEPDGSGQGRAVRCCSSHRQLNIHRSSPPAPGNAGELVETAARRRGRFVWGKSGRNKREQGCAWRRRRRSRAGPPVAAIREREVGMA